MEVLETPKQDGSKSGYHHGDLRAELLKAVEELIEEKGAENFSIAEAARKAGVSSAAPYRHFKDRRALVKAVVMEAMARQAAAMRDAVKDHPKRSLERLNALGRCYIEYATNHPGMFRTVFGISESHEDDPELIERGTATFGIVIEAVADVMGLSHDDPQAKMRAYLLWTGVHGHSWLMIDGKAKSHGVDLEQNDLLNAMSEGLVGRYITG